MIRTLAFALFCMGSAVAQHSPYTVYGNSANDSFGQSVDVVGDVDGDGYSDFMVGAWRDDGGGLVDSGTVFVYSGVDASLIYTILGTGGGDHMGYGSSGAGDVNADGFADILAAADEDNVGGLTNAGSAQVISGADGSTLYSFAGDSAGELFGWSTSSLGDVNNDGFDDFAIGALNDDDPPNSLTNAGSVTVYSGFDGSTLYKFFGQGSSQSFGSDVGRAGDVNADGHADIIAAGASATNVRVFSGFDGSVLYTIPGSVGADVSGDIDANGDGYDDFIIGRRSASGGRGQVTVYSGFDAAVLHVFTGDSPNDNLGDDVRGAGDLDGDGYGDIVAGAPLDDDNGNSSGSVRAFSGADGRVLFTFYGDNAGDRLGTSVSAGGDIDGDGFLDIVAGGLGFDGGGNNSGGARAFSWVPDGLTPFGAGTPGCRGIQLLGGDGVPSIGTTFTLLSGNAEPNQSVMVLLSDVSDPSGTLLPELAVLLHIAFPPTASFWLHATTTTDGAGSLSLPLVIPPDASLVGLDFVFQVLSPWSGGCAPYSSSKGLSVRIQP